MTKTRSPAKAGSAAIGAAITPPRARPDAEHPGAASAAPPEALAMDPRGVVRDIPLDRLKKSPKNARKTPHTLEAVEALAASIAAKALIHFPTVEAEVDAEGEATGDFLVTIGEGRRLALNLLAVRGVIAKDAQVRCVLNGFHDPFEISLDENVTRTDMHPADQFEAFQQLAETRGWGAEEIAARFGVSAHVVRQRLRLGAISPRLMALYRAEELALDQLMAFAVSDDHARQEQVLDALSWNKTPAIIRRMMTEQKAPADDRRARFVGAEAYAEAGGTILRDLFTDDGGGWFEDIVLLDRLTAEKLDAEAQALQVQEGWKWVEAHRDFPYAQALTRVYARPVERSDEDRAAIAALAEEYDTLTETWAEAEDLPPDVESRLAEIEQALRAWGDETAYASDDIARSGAYVILGFDGTLRIERGFQRPEDRAAPPPADDIEADGEEAPEQGGGGAPLAAEDAEPEEPDGLTPLSERLVTDLTAHRTAALRDALAQDPDVAILALTHALVLRIFYAGAPAASCLDIRPVSLPLGRLAEGIEDQPPCRRINDRHGAWASQLPEAAEAVWDFLIGLDGDSRASLLAHCVSLTVDAVRQWERRPALWAHADVLAQRLSLNVAADWSPTVASYLGRVTKARIREAIAEGVSAEAAERLADLKKPEMAEAAEAALAGRRWLPPLLRTPGAAVEASEPVETIALAAE